MVYRLVISVNTLEGADHNTPPRIYFLLTLSLHSIPSAAVSQNVIILSLLSLPLIAFLVKTLDSRLIESRTRVYLGHLLT
jgi:hypothetical protein